MDAAVNRDLFLEKLNALIAGKREDNCSYFSQEKYSKILSEVVSAKTNCTKPLDYRRLKRFDVLKVDNEKKLIVPLKPGETNIQYYVTNEELFTILHETHTRIGHRGRTRMLQELQVKYKNITYEVVTLYLNLCKQCQTKHSAPKKGIVAKPVASSELNSRCQVDLIDLESNKDGEYKFIMVYQDHLTKFVQLRPLKTKAAEEVAHNLLSIFLTFGAPAILQSDHDTEFSNEVISKICAVWKDVKMVHGRRRDKETQGSVERANQDIQNMLTAWMNDNGTTKWSDGLPFVQFAKNTTYDEGIRQSPFEALFGVKAKRGIVSSFLGSEQIASIKTEEQLEEIVNSFETEEQLEETVNTSEKNLSGGNTESHSPRENIEEDLQSTSSQQDLTEKRELISVKRAAAKEDLPLQARKMLRTSRKQFRPAQIGDTANRKSKSSRVRS